MEKKFSYFEYDGLSYIPVRTLTLIEKDMIYNRSKKQIWNNCIIEKPKNGENYNLSKFMEVSFSKNVDLFYCVERGCFVTPVENGILNLNEKSLLGYFQKLKTKFLNSEKTQKVLKNVRPLFFNNEKDLELMRNISLVICDGEVFTESNINLGIIRIKQGNPEHDGIIHIIKRRMDKRILHDKMNYDIAVKETAAIIFLAIKNISEAPATKETNGRYAIYKNGIKTAIDSDKFGRYVVTGFEFEDTKREATDSIKAVNALYGYTPEFLEIYAQVGAAYASLSNNITYQNLGVNKNNHNSLSNEHNLLYKQATLIVNGKKRVCRSGLLEGFKNCVKRLDKAEKLNQELINENKKLKEIINRTNDNEISF